MAYEECRVQRWQRLRLLRVQACVSLYFFVSSGRKTLASNLTGSSLLSRARVARADITNHFAVTLNRTRRHVSRGEVVCN